MDLIVFDLDGTLIDSKLDLAHAVNAARVHLGLERIGNEIVDSYVGHGAPMAVLTNKPVRFSQAILDGIGLAGHFRFVYGGNSFEFKKPHPIGIETILTQAAIPRENAIMVGDSGVDVQTARNAHIQAC